MRLLMQLFEQPHNALQLGIWKTKVSLYQQALRRLNPQQFWDGLPCFYKLMPQSKACQMRMPNI